MQKLEVSIDRDDRIAHLRIIRKDGVVFAGYYCSYDAKMHEKLGGHIINADNFIEIIEEFARIDRDECQFARIDYDDSKMYVKLRVCARAVVAAVTGGRAICSGSDEIIDTLDIVCPRAADEIRARITALEARFERMKQTYDADIAELRAQLARASDCKK